MRSPRQRQVKKLPGFEYVQPAGLDCVEYVQPAGLDCVECVQSAGLDCVECVQPAGLDSRGSALVQTRETCCFRTEGSVAVALCRRVDEG